MTLPFDNSYARLPERFYARQDPVPVKAPSLAALNRPLAERLGLDADWLASAEGIAMLAGNTMPPGAEPLAQAYAGHQFGGWVPTLGDGRAILLGEVVAPDGARFDIQLKGAGRTPFSRRGDGRAWIGPVLREYIVSEAFAALGIPTTRALAALTTGEVVVRDAMGRPGAILARVASSHVRVGTFQYFAARGDEDALISLCNFMISRHYPDATSPLDLLSDVVAAQADLVARWMSVGFIHGVMNTDNMALSGETIDFGPCAFMDDYHPQTVFSSIDQFGRYAYANQPQIAAWNLAQLATCLLPLMGERDAAIEAATEAVHGFAPIYQGAWLRYMGAKLGLSSATEDDRPLIEDLLSRMAVERADFTRTFHGLRSGKARAEFIDPAAFDTWAPAWQARLAREETPTATMAAANPVRIPRNHRIEEVIVAATDGNFAPFERLSAALRTPFADDPAFAEFELAPVPDERVLRTFCGT
ncbi:protein adenylyltransferase SelO [Sedimentimonas flavescens]|uniref:protein adenylyltransferase SelO n=1 Tax=Sedimentimonas flavescens TaxID=2851012 RepID=UPI001C49CCF1|nr:YdiU family protein [Sedimentimonas flavescens]MBW0157248.1 YdiU family protein [Sedimentimonas flavescens]